MESLKNNAKSLWNSVVEHLEVEFDSVLLIDLWFKPLDAICIDGNTLYLSSETQSNIDMITKYIPDIQKVLAKLNTCVSNVSIILEKNVNQNFHKINAIIPPTYILPNVKIDLDTCATEVTQEAQPLPAVVQKAQPSVPQKELNLIFKDPQEDNFQPSVFNRKYTFDNFVVGKSNQFVHAAAKSIVESPGIRYNPLFIYGGVGLGKTHLVHAIGNELAILNPSLRVRYVTSERFMNEFIESIQGGKTTRDGGFNSSFRERYRNIDVLMIDDIQFIAKAEMTQEEFFHTFNDLYNQNKQIVITSDKAPREMLTLVDRLRSRFEWGLITDIQPPDMETRIAILKKKAEQERCNISYDVLSYIAQKVTSNIREMEGLLNRVIFFATLNNTRVSLEVAEEATRDYLDKKKEAVDIDSIINTVCGYYDVTKEDLLGKKRTKEIVIPRQICMYLISELLTIPLTSIGEKFGRDHTTIMHARDKVTMQLSSDSSTATAVKDLKNMILKQ